jgi:HTH-type transcriptional regulator/antitoxin HipB
MNFPIDTPVQARAVLRALRRARDLSQTQVGQLLGVSQKRVARIEAAPDRTSFDQITKLVAILGGRVVIEDTRPVAGRKTKPASAGW